MRIIEPSTQIIIPPLEGVTVQDFLTAQMKKVELVGRICYKSEHAVTADSYKKFIKMLCSLGHEAMIEHGGFTVKFICDRGVSHELVRHRLASWAQESTRYCNYGKDKFGNECAFIKPFFFGDWKQTGKTYPTEEYAHWAAACETAEKQYFNLLALGKSPQEARSVLPNSLKTEVIMTANFREWRNFFRLRADKAAHPQMRQVVIPLLLEVAQYCPEIFGDIPYDTEFTTS